MRIRLKPTFPLNPDRFVIIRRIFAHFGGHLRQYRRTLLAAWGCMLGATAMELARPWPIKIIFDDILLPPAAANNSSWLPAWLQGDTGLLLAAVAISILLIAVLRGLFGFGQTYLIASVGQKVVATVRRQLYSHIQRLSHSFHDANHSGDLLLRLTGDIHLLRELLVGSLIFLSERTLVLVAMLGIMFWMDWQLTLIAISVLPLLAFTAFRFSGRIRGATKRQRRKETYTANVISETVSAITVVQAFAREKHQDEQFARQNRASMKAGLRATKLEANLNRIVDVVLALGTCGVLWFGVQRVLAGALSPGELLVFVA